MNRFSSAGYSTGVSSSCALTVCAVLLLWSALCCSAGLAAAGLEVTVQTTDCVGDVGFATFNTGDLYKIQGGDCVDPDTGEELQQVLLQSRDARLRYDVLWVTRDEARNILRQIKDINRARMDRLSGPEIKIEHQAVIRQEAAPQQAPVAPPTSSRQELPGPVINIYDPPVSNTRSITRIITPAQVNTRLVVGQIEAAAGLLSLSINGRTQNVDEQGLFKTQVLVGTAETPVVLLAIDRQGKQSSVEFRLLPQSLKDTATDESSAPDAGTFGNYHALVIANNKYEWLDDLRTPLNDAEAISRVLEQRYGFTVTRLNNANRYEMISALNAARRELTEKDNLLLYFAGHGEYDKTNNRGHWLPSDAELDSTANWISTVEITDIINAMSAKHVLVIADSCYSGALTRSTNTELDPNLSEDLRSQWLQMIARNRSRYVMTSGGVKPVLDDGGNGHSVFANALLLVLEENQGLLESSRLYREVRQRVRQRAEELQVDHSPQYAKLKNTGHEFGEFILVGKPGAP